MVLLTLLACLPPLPPADGRGRDTSVDFEDTSSETGASDDTSPDDTGESPVDSDGDGYTVAEGDCADNDTRRYPGAPEVCDGIDNDCDGLVDVADTDVVRATLYYPDADGDGFGTGAGELACSPPEEGYAPLGGDCYDGSALAFPGQTLYQTTQRGDGSFDYDCDGFETLEYDHCSTTGSTTSCCWDEGWLGAGQEGAEFPPACGVEGHYVWSTGATGYFWQACL